ncbi:MAG: glycosyltransferase, partial [Chitinophagaceae bacterium]
VIEFILSKLFGSRIIYDFDDAIWIPNTTAENKIASWFKAVWKVKYICQWAYKISAGNNYLLDYARKYNSNSFLIPTCIDAVNAHNRLKQHQNSEVVIGWTGSHSTLTYLDEILPVIERLSREYSFIFMVIANKDPRLQLSNYRFKPWKEETEVEDLLSFDIGVMPLSPDPWSEGKCGFKLIQYLALGIPAVASPVGVNKDIIKEGNNGFLATTPDEWYIHLSKLLTDLELRKTMGHRGRQLVVENYSVQAYRNRFLQLFS